MSWGYNGKTDTPWQPKPGLVSKRRVTRQDADEMARLRRSGLTTEAIGSMFRVNRGTVEYHLKRLLTDREREQISLDCRRRGKQRQAKVERNAQIIELRRQGKSIREVALAFGVSTRPSIARTAPKLTRTMRAIGSDGSGPSLRTTRRPPLTNCNGPFGLLGPKKR